MAWRRNLQVSSVGTSAERLGVGADHDGGRAAGAKGAATEETRKGLRLRILPGTGCHRAGPPSKSGARAGGGRSDDFTQSNCGGTEAELATSATTCLHPQPPSRAYICVRNHADILPPDVDAIEEIAVYDEFAEVDGLTVPAKCSIYGKDRSALGSWEWRGWSFDKPFDESRMVMPSNAVLDTSSPTRTARTPQY